jgi:hypothetical protein
MTLLLKILNTNLNNNLDNDWVFYGIFVGVTGTIGYSLANQIFRKTYEEKGVQTDAGTNISDSSSQIIPENVTSIDTLSPLSLNVQDTSSLTPTTSEVGIQTIAGDVTPINKEVIPNQDKIERDVDLSNPEYIAAKVEQLNALDPFSSTPWTPERVSAMIDTLGVVNNLFN